MRHLPLLLLLTSFVSAAEVKGAAALLEAAQASEAMPAPARSGTRPSLAEWSALAADPRRTAAGWLALVDRWRVGVSEPTGSGDEEVKAMLGALPLPAEWPAVVAGLKQRFPATPPTVTTTTPPAPGDGVLSALVNGLLGSPEQDDDHHNLGWHLLIAVLERDEVARWQVYDRMPADRNSWQRQRLGETLAATTRDPARLASFISQSGNADYQRSVELPDLVTRLGEAGARTLLLQALGKPLVDLKVQGTATRRLARSLAIGLEPLPSRPWSLTLDREGGPLYRRLVALSPPTTGGRTMEDWIRRQADAWDLTRQVLDGDRAGVTASVAGLGARAKDIIACMPLNHLQEQDPVAVAELLQALVDADPASPLWPTYAQAAALAGRVGALRERLDRFAPDAVRQPKLIELLLAADRIAPATAALTARLAAKPGEEDAQQLLAVALALDLAPEPQAAVTAVEALLTTPVAKAGTDAEETRASADLPQLLAQAGRADLAEALLARRLPSQKPRREHGWSQDQALRQLARLYHHLGRPADVLLLCERARGWQGSDLSDLYDDGDLHQGTLPFATVVALALEAVGRIPEAVQAACLGIDAEPASDGAWALLARRDPAALERAAGLIRRRCPLEERPLIWRAQAALDRGDSAAAEALAREAMALDPSDGDQGPGDRMRARAVLAEALERLGRPEDAKPLRQAVAAIRLGEEGDRFLRAGLTARAVERWTASEALLDRTYCVQSRLAVHLLEAGDLAGAEVHFRKAYALMPRAFGRRESHCFGCEGVFSGPFAQKIAEPVFRDLIAQDPANPKHHYLLGYLRKVQHREAEALTLLREAVRLDPDYLSAWETLLQLKDDYGLPPEVEHHAVLALVRLADQEQWHWRLGGFDDLAALATALDTRGVSLPVATRPVFHLGPEATTEEERQFSFHRSADTPGLASHPLLEAVASLLE